MTLIIKILNSFPAHRWFSNTRIQEVTTYGI